MSTKKIQRNLQIIRIVSASKVAEYKFNIQISTAFVNINKKQNIIFKKKITFITSHLGFNITKDTQDLYSNYVPLFKGINDDLNKWRHHPNFKARKIHSIL